MYDERFPGAPFMVSKSGLTIEHFGNENRRNNTDKEMFPPEDLLPPPSKTGPVDIGATTFPAAGFDIHVIFKYDNNFLAEFGANVESRINAIVGHANILFQFPTLDAKMTVIIDAIEHYDGVVVADDLELVQKFSNFSYDFQ